ncbi:MAG: DUF885 domain-containing protein [Gemmatimonadales bacterium]|nr:DUF885 domain-containing protein [Gemmatimonadales bacterium]
MGRNKREDYGPRNVGVLPPGRFSVTSRSGRGIVAAAVTLSLACSTGQPAPAAPDWDRFVAGFLESYFRANPPFAVNQGRHEFDGGWPDWSEAGLEGWVGRLHALRDGAVDFRLPPADSTRRLERDYLVSRIDDDLFWLEQADWPRRNPEWYSDQIDPNVYLAREYAPLPQRMRAFIRYAEGLPRALAQMRSNLRTPLPKVYAEIAQGRFSGLASYLEQDVPTVFAPVTDAALRASFEVANAEAIRALSATGQWFAAEAKRGTDDFAMGAELFQRMLWETEGVEVSLERLEEVGRADLERNLAAIRAACARFAPGRPIPECAQRVNANKTAGGPVAGALRQLDTLEQFLRERQLVSIPGTEQALVRESPPYQRFNSAYIDIPGPYEKGLPSIYYIAPPDPSWSLEEQRAYVPGAAELLFTSVHEVWPGHFLNFLHSNRARSTFGKVFVGYAFAEGWAHYTEEMVWEAGLGGGDAEVHIGQLLNALLRNVRYMSAIGLHTKGMTVAESERMFREQGYQDAGNARQQAARGTYDPAYLNYTLGKLMIMKLREDWTKSRGGRMAWREFHDRFLSYGGPPIPLVRREMLGEGEGL